MSMDEVEARARALEAGLRQFNASLRIAFEEVMHAHGDVAPLWDDNMRRNYDRIWKPLEENMRDYTRRIGPDYVNFLIARLQHLHNYLHGHGA